MSIGSNIRIYFQTKRYNIKEQIYVISHFYKKGKFLVIDLVFLFLSLFFNPYRISKKFLKRKGKKEIHLYGETPLSTMQKIVKECSLSSSDKILEIGSGRGRTCFWLAEFVGCRVLGVEWIPFFAKTAKFISKLFKVNNLDFFCQDMQRPGMVSHLQEATCLYLYGTCLEDHEIDQFLKNIQSLSPDTKIITISYSLSDYDSKNYKMVRSFFVSFPWGNTECFLNQKI